jgi:steroid 5-alpha reductase family enzyme
MADSVDHSPVRARLICTLAYLVSLAAAALFVLFAPIDDPFWRVVAADVVGTVVIFGFCFRYDNSSLYDAYWSVAPIVMVGFWLYTSTGLTPRRLLVFGLVSAWGMRLTYNWVRHWRGLKHEDWRYADLRDKTGKLYWLVSLAGIHLYPTAMVMAASVSAYVVMTSAAPLSWVDALAFTVTAGAIVIEATADRQLHDFARDNDDPKRILDTGLWAWSRHPNYFGEMSFWWGLYIFALSARPDAWWCAIGPAAITSMFSFISIPMIDKRMLAKRPHYAAHIKKVSRVLPWPPR